MLILVSDGFSSTYRHRHKLYNYGLRYESSRWKLNTQDEALIEEIERFCRRKHLRFEKIEDKYVRSTDYRRNFDKHYQKKDGKYYRCAYCGRKITKDRMTVDHIIPIDKVQHYWRYRKLMDILGIKNINDVKNLAPACEKCNKHKGREINFSYLAKGLIGRTYKGVVVRKWVEFIIILILLVLLFVLSVKFNMYEYILDLLITLNDIN